MQTSSCSEVLSAHVPVHFDTCVDTQSILFDYVYTPFWNFLLLWLKYLFGPSCMYVT